MSNQSKIDARLTFRSCMTQAVKAQRASGAVGTQLFKLARKCENVDDFLFQCKEQEEWVVSPEAGQMREESVPACWTQAKSDIKQAWSRGITPKTNKSYYGMRQAKLTAAKAERQQTQQQRQPLSVGPSHDPVVVTTVEEALAEGTVVDAKTNVLLPDELREMVRYLDRLPELARAKAVKQFTKEAKRLADIESQNKSKHHAAPPPKRGARPQLVASNDADWEKEWANAKPV